MDNNEYNGQSLQENIESSGWVTSQNGGVVQSRLLQQPTDPQIQPPRPQPTGPQVRPPRPQPTGPQIQPPRPQPTGPQIQPPRPQPTGPQIQPPRPQPTGPQIQPPRPQPTGPQIQPPRPRPTGPQIQPPRPRPTGPQIQPPRPRPTGPQIQPPRPQPPESVIPPYGSLPAINILPPAGQAIGRGNCIGPASSTYASQIETLIRQELTLYQSFARWADANPRNRAALRQVAEESLSRAKLLLSAYYFITDQIYWPTSLQSITPLTSFSREMQQLYAVIKGLERDYLIAYRSSTDRCLGALYHSLANRANRQARVVYKLT